MKKTLLQCVLCASLFVSCAQAANADRLIDAMTPADILQIAANYGPTKLGQDDNGDPLVSGKINGIGYEIIFYGCDSGKDCEDILFKAQWRGAKLSADKINEWNRDRKFGKAFVDDDNILTVDMAVNLHYGVSAKNFADTFDYWNRVTGEFKDFIDE